MTTFFFFIIISVMNNNFFTYLHTQFHMNTANFKASSQLLTVWKVKINHKDYKSLAFHAEKLS